MQNAVVSSNRSAPLYEFRAGRLVDLDGNGFPEYLDGLGGSTPRPFVYFSAYEGQGYDPDDNNYNYVNGLQAYLGDPDDDPNYTVTAPSGSSGASPRQTRRPLSEMSPVVTTSYQARNPIPIRPTSPYPLTPPGTSISRTTSHVNISIKIPINFSRRESTTISGSAASSTPTTHWTRFPSPRLPWSRRRVNRRYRPTSAAASATT